jgi:hypothetical protein
VRDRLHCGAGCHIVVFVFVVVQFCVFGCGIIFGCAHLLAFHCLVVFLAVNDDVLLTPVMGGDCVDHYPR